MDHLSPYHKTLSPENAHSLLFFQKSKKRTNFGVVKIHANPYFTESLSYLSYESIFGLEFFRVAESKLNKALTYKKAVLQTLVDTEH